MEKAHYHKLWASKPWFDDVLALSWTFRVVGISFSNVFYLWATAHSYGLLTRIRTRRGKLHVLWPKAYFDCSLSNASNCCQVRVSG